MITNTSCDHESATHGGHARRSVHVVTSWSYSVLARLCARDPFAPVAFGVLRYCHCTISFRYALRTQFCISWSYAGCAPVPRRIGAESSPAAEILAMTLSSSKRIFLVIEPALLIAGKYFVMLFSKFPTEILLVGGDRTDVPRRYGYRRCA